MTRWITPPTTRTVTASRITVIRVPNVPSPTAICSAYAFATSGKIGDGSWDTTGGNTVPNSLLTERVAAAPRPARVTSTVPTPQARRNPLRKIELCSLITPASSDPKMTSKAIASGRMT